MKSIKIGVLIGIVALLTFAIAAGGVGAQGPTPPGSDTPGGAVAAAISYQGRLTSPTTGAPLTGTYDLEFTFWSLAGGGIQVGSTILKDDQAIANGLYSTQLNVNAADFSGQELWLRIRVRPGAGGTWETLSPRVQVLPTAYALSLRPGALIQGDPTAWDGWVFKTNMTGAFPLGKAMLGTTATGMAVRGDSTGGYGLYGYSPDGNAILGESNAKTAGIFSSNEGYGITVNTNGTDHWDHAGVFSANMGWGVYATSAYNQAVRGEAGDVSGASMAVGPWGAVGRGENGGVFGSSGNGLAGVYGTSTGGAGVRGSSTDSKGVYGETSSDDDTAAAGVWGYKASGGGDAMRGLKYGDWGRAIYGTNWGSIGSGVAGESTNYVGVWGESTNDIGIYAKTGRVDNYYGLYSEDYIWALGYTVMGAVIQVVQNGSSEALEPGDVAVFSGMAAPLEKGGPPVVQVAKATAANSTAVAGVVCSRFNIQVVTNHLQSDGRNSVAGLEVAPAGPVQPGEYLLLIIQGPAQVKASAAAGAIRPGDLLSSAGTAGFAAKAATVDMKGVQIAVPGTVFGKALEPLSADQKLIYVFVTLQ